MQGSLLQEQKSQNSVAEQNAKFIQGRCLKEYIALLKHKGEFVNIIYLRNDGYKYAGAGKLLAVYPFKGIKYAGGYVPFIDKDKAIFTITGKGGEIIYDRTDIFNNNSRFADTDLFSGYQFNVLGTNKPEECIKTLYKSRQIEQKR